ncbi:MAG TPA: pilus assembly protein TadE, partial [Propionicimonas sp.]
MAITVVGLLVLAGLVVDGGVKIRAAQHADAVAAEAARAAGQMVALPEVVGHQDVTVDRQGAVNAANAYLAAAGETGSVVVGPDGTTVEVTVTTSS